MSQNSPGTQPPKTLTPNTAKSAELQTIITPVADLYGTDMSSDTQ